MRIIHKHMAMLGLMLLATGTASAGGLDTKNMRYDEYRFSHSSLAADKQAAQFKTDGESCEKDGQEAFEAMYQKRKALSDLYGVAVDRKALLELKKVGFIHCMCGSSEEKTVGKGWVVKRQE